MISAAFSGLKSRLGSPGRKAAPVGRVVRASELSFSFVAFSVAMIRPMTRSTNPSCNRCRWYTCAISHSSLGHCSVNSPGQRHWQSKHEDVERVLSISPGRQQPMRRV